MSDLPVPRLPGGNSDSPFEYIPGLAAAKKVAPPTAVGGFVLPKVVVPGALPLPSEVPKTSRLLIRTATSDVKAATDVKVDNTWTIERIAR